MSELVIRLTPNSRTLDRLFRILAAMALALFLFRALGAFSVSRNPVLLLVAIAETLTIALVILSRFPMVRSTHPFDVVITIVGTFYFLFIQLETGTSLLDSPWPIALQSIAILWQIAAKYTLGRSFGLLPANRGVVQSGPYRVVRHPIYLGYLIGHIGFLMAFFSIQNAALIAIVYVFQVARILREESVLGQDPAYRVYMHRTPWRLIPGIF